jgi:hypothetical protein
MSTSSSLLRMLLALISLLSPASATTYMRLDSSRKYMLLLIALDAYPQIAQAATILSGHRERLYSGSPNAVRGVAFEGYTSSGVAHQTIPDTTITMINMNATTNNNNTNINGNEDLESTNLTSTTTAAFRRRLNWISGESAPMGDTLFKRARRNANAYKFLRKLSTFS